MANGDAAAAAGLAVFPATQDHAQGYDNDNIRGDELASHIVDGTHPWKKITDKPATFPPSSGSVGTAQLKDGAVTLAKMANNSVDTAQIRAGAVRFDELGEGAVTASRIREGSIEEDHIQNEAVVARHIYPESIEPRHMVDGAVTNDKLRDGAVGTDKLAGNSITLAKMTDQSVGWNELTTAVRDRIDDTSSLRYKEDIVDAGLDVDAVLGLRPVTYHRKDAPAGTRELGLIAEEVDAAGLEELVVVRDGLVDGVRYQVLAVALLAAVKDQAAQLEQLTERVRELEAPSSATPDTDQEA